jgi:ubiquinol-cytochrome c reductase cytochrome c subunit
MTEDGETSSRVIVTERSGQPPPGVPNIMVVHQQTDLDPTVVRSDSGEIEQESLRGGDVARGSELFRLNCASCHNFTGRGGALSSGKYAPTLDPANEQQIYQAMVTGPQNMPKFSDRQLSPEEKKDIIAYVKSSSETQPPGGYGLGGFGPGTEAIAIWVVGIGLIVGAALWIGVRS